MRQLDAAVPPAAQNTTAMENKIIIFSNIKGGVGKTTLCSLFASWVAEKGCPVITVDADLQASLYRHRQREHDADPEAQQPWGVEMLNTADEKSLKAVMKKLKGVPGLVLIDCPGNLNDRNLQHIYAQADAAVIPMSFDPDTVDATGIFIKAFKTISQAQLVFVPNRINAAEKRADELVQRTRTIEFLGLVGTVTPRIKQSVAVKRYTTLYAMERKQQEAVAPAFDKIIQALNITL